MDTYTLTVRCHGSDGEPIPGAMVTAQLERAAWKDGGLIAPTPIQATADAQGNAPLTLVPSDDPQYRITVRTPQGRFLESRRVSMPEADTTLSALVG